MSPEQSEAFLHQLQLKMQITETLKDIKSQGSSVRFYTRHLQEMTSEEIEYYAEDIANALIRHESE